MTETATTPAPATPPVVVIDKLWSIFGEGERAFAVHQDLDLTVHQGEMLSIVGGSGTGKTVLLRQILGLLHPGKGTVTTLGRPAAELCNAQAASRVGMLFQQGRCIRPSMCWRTLALHCASRAHCLMPWSMKPP